MHIDYFNSGRILSSDDIELVSDFLFKELGQYGDPKTSIAKAIDYAMDRTIRGGGLVAIAYDERQYKPGYFPGYNRPSAYY